MKAFEVYRILDTLAPYDTQADFDNSSFNVGDRNAEVTGVAVCLDVTPTVLRAAKKNNCNTIVSHHPCIFHAVKNITAGDGLYEILSICMAESMNLISCHTNLDSCEYGASFLLLSSLFGVTPTLVPEHFAAVATLPRGIKADEMSTLLNAQKYKYPVISRVSSKKAMKKIVCIGGAGGGDFDVRAARDLGDCLITSEVRHSAALYAESMGFNIFEIDHADCENICLQSIANALSAVGVKVVVL